jgi:hypothetical protein
MTGNSEGCPDYLGETRTDDTDNQQKRVTDLDLGWLAGIIEGEGCFYLQATHNRKQTAYSPQIFITNTNERIIAKAERIIKALGLACYIYLQKQGSYRNCWKVAVMGMKRVQRFIHILYPYIECRREQLECLKTFTEERLSKIRTAPYGEKELWAIECLHKLNRPYLFPETNTSAAAA